MGRIYILLKLLIVLSLVNSLSCTRESSREEKSPANSQHFLSYSRDGLSLLHPSHWVFAHDGSTNTPTSSRGVAFDTSDYSRVMVLIYGSKSLVVTDLADQYVRELQLESEHIENFRKKPVEINGFQGLQLSWWDGPVTAEITIVDIRSEEASVFVIFQLMNDDIINETQYLIPFLKGVQFINIADDGE